MLHNPHFFATARNEKDVRKRINTPRPLFDQMSVQKDPMNKPAFQVERRVARLVKLRTQHPRLPQYRRYQRRPPRSPSPTQQDLL